MNLNLNLPLYLNDGTPVKLVGQTGSKLRILIPRHHPMADGDHGPIRDFALDGTRNNVGASPPYNYYLINHPELPTDREWEKILFDMPKGEAIAELRKRGLIRPAVKGSRLLAAKIVTLLEDDPSNPVDRVEALILEYRDDL